MGRLIMLVALAGVASLGFGSALVFAGSNAGTSQSGLRVVLVHHADRRTAACSSGSIQDEVNVAPAGSTITVCNGTYTEQVTIPAGKDGLTLLAQSKHTVIKAPAPVVGGQQGAIVKVEAQHVTIEGFTISGPGSGPPGSIGYGVEVVTGASATVDSNDILDIRDEPLSGDQNGWAIGAIGGSVTATSNLIKGYQKTGIKLTGDGTVNTITGNTIVGAGEIGTVGQNGIFIAGGASATVSGNHVSKVFYTGTGASAGGIIATGSGDVAIENNTLSGNQINVWVNGIAQGVNVSVSGNAIHHGSYGIIVQAASAVRVVDNTTNGQTTDGLFIDAKDNTFDGNNASGVTGDGHYDCADVSHGNLTANTANTWTNNTGKTAFPAGICSPTAPPTTSTSTTTETTTVTVTVPATTVTVPPQTITHSVTATVTLPAVTITTPGADDGRDRARGTVHYDSDDPVTNHHRASLDQDEDRRRHGHRPLPSSSSAAPCRQGARKAQDPREDDRQDRDPGLQKHWVRKGLGHGVAPESAIARPACGLAA